MPVQPLESPWGILCRENPETYEKYVLAACMKSETLWRKLERVLCVRNSRNYTREVNDFTSQSAYVLFRIVKAFHTSSAIFSEPDILAIVTLLSTSAAIPVGFVMTDAKRQAIISLAIEVLQIEKVLAETVVTETWKDWLHNVQVLSSFADIRRGGFSSDLQTKIDQVNELKAALDAADSGDDGNGLNTFAEWSDKLDNVVERMPMGHNFANLNALLGGGFGKGEHVLAVVPSGGGKTVLACQVATELAQAGRHVMLISTEQRPAALLPRIYSSMSWEAAPTPNGRMSYKMLKDSAMKLLYPKLNSEQQEVVQKINAAVGSYIHMDIWDNTRGSVGYIEEMLDKYNRQLAEKGEKGIEMIILDWIGSTIQPKPGEELRHLMLRASEEMYRLAESYNVGAMSTCQTNDKGRTAKLVGSEHIAEAKGIIQTATVAFGISTLEANQEQGMPSDGVSKYAVKQFLNGFKVRHSEARVFEVTRNFAYMRYNKM